MKRIVSLVICLTLFIRLHGQNERVPLFMTAENNLQWLKSAREAPDKRQKWELIVERYFNQTIATARLTPENQYCPLLLIDGIPYQTDHNMSDEVRKQIRNLITSEKIGSISIVDREPDGNLMKPFSGIILVTLNDKGREIC
jgi:hypothetical protein